MGAIHPEEEFIDVQGGPVENNQQEVIEIPRQESPAPAVNNNTLTALLALAKAQRSIGRVAKTGNNPHFNSKYVELHALLDATNEALESHGLFVLQTPQVNDRGEFVLETLIMHETGAMAARSEWPIRAKDMNDPQKIGGAMTYARRYSLMALMNVAGEDDDGNRASQPATPEPADELRALLSEQGVKPEDFSSRLQKEYSKSRLAELTQAQIKKEITFYKKQSESGAPF